MFFTGVGSRECPTAVQTLMTSLAQLLANANYVLRSGGARGADSAFEAGCDAGSGAKEIYLPWRGFEKNASPLFKVGPDAFEMAKLVHPAWEGLSLGERKLHAQSCYQVLGASLSTPSQLLVCWTPDGCESQKTRSRKTGGTATSIVLAERHAVPVFNLRNAPSRERLADWLLQRGVSCERIPLRPPSEPLQATLF